MTEINYLQKAKTAEKKFQSVFSRMDSDRDLIAVADRVLKDTAKLPKKIPNSIFVPLNDLIVFVTTVESYLGDAEETVQVTSEDKNLDTADIETIIKAIWREINARWRKGIGTGGRQFEFTPFINQQTCRRGYTCNPVRFRIDKNGVLVPDVRAWDTRFRTFGMDGEGLDWVSYLTTRPPDMVKQDYPDVKVDMELDSVEIRDILTRQENIIYVNDQEASRKPHDHGECPVVLETVGIGSMTMDSESAKSEGESVLLMVRDIFPELMRYASIIQSLNMKELDHALQEGGLPEEQMDGNPPPEHDQITNPRSVTKTAGSFTPIPIGELKQMAENLHQMLEVRMQRGGINNFDMGTFNQYMSAVALIRVGQGRDKVSSFRLVAEALAKKDITEMGIRQILKQAKEKGIRTLKISNQEYDLSLLKNQYEIDFKYTITDATVDAARQSIAAAQRGMLPQIAILRDTLKREDPEGDIRQLRIEEASIIFPQLKKYDVIKALAEEAEKGDEDAEIKLQMALDDLGVTLDQVMAGNLPKVQQLPEAAPPAQPVNIFDTGTARQGVEQTV